MAELDQRDQLPFLDRERQKKKEDEEKKANALEAAFQKLAADPDADRQVKQKAQRAAVVARAKASSSRQAQEGEVANLVPAREAVQAGALGAPAPQAPSEDVLLQLFDQVQQNVLQNRPREAYSSAIDLIATAKALDRQSPGLPRSAQGQPQAVGPLEQQAINFLFSKERGILPDYLKRSDIEATAPGLIGVGGPNVGTPQGTNTVTTAGGRTLGINPTGPFGSGGPGPAVTTPSAAPPITPQAVASPGASPLVGPPNPGGFDPISPAVKGFAQLLGALGTAGAGAAANISNPSALRSFLPSPAEVTAGASSAAPPTQGFGGAQEFMARQSLAPAPSPASPSGEVIVEDERGRRFRFVPDFPGQVPPPNLRVVG